MNFGKTYQDATTPMDADDSSLREEQQKAEQIRQDQLATQRKIDHNRWLQDPHTNLVIRELREKSNELLTQALAEASQYSKHNNHLNIIHLLNQVNSINNILNTYARTNNTK